MAQNDKIDSLKKVLRTAGQDTNKVNALNALSRKLYETGNYDTSLIYAGNAKTLAEKIASKKGMADAYNNIGSVYYSEGNYPEALKNYFASLKINETMGNQQGAGASYNNIGNVYSSQANYPKALDYYFKALKMKENLPGAGWLGDKNGIANTLTNIGIVYDEQADYPKALDYYFKALKMFENLPTLPRQAGAGGLGDNNGIANTLSNIGIVYGEQADYPKALDYFFKALKVFENLPTAGGLGDKHGIANTLSNIGNIYISQANANTNPSQMEGLFTKALDYYFKALKMGEDLGDKYGIANTLSNIGNIYISQANAHTNPSQREGLFTKALDYYFRALKMGEDLGDKYGIATVLCNIGKLYIATGKFKEAEEYLKRSIVIAGSIGDRNTLMHVEESLSKLYDTTGTSHPLQSRGELLKLALIHYKKAMALKDSIFSEESKKQLVRKEMNYEFEKKEAAAKAGQEKKDAIAAEEKIKQKIIRNVVVAVAALVIILLMLLYNRKQMRLKHQYQVNLNRRLQEHTAAVLAAQENERKRIAQDLHDGIGQALSGIIINLEHFNNEIMPVLHEEKQIQLNKTLDSLDGVYKEIRSLSHQMLPRALKETGLAAAIADTLEKTFFNTKIKYKFDSHQANDIPETIAAGIYRIFQELLSNLVKHAVASEASVQLYKNKNQLILIVEDNGIGMNFNSYSNVNTTPAQSGIGLLNITGRVQAMNGTFSIDPGPFKGTVISVKVPLFAEIK